MPDQERMGSLLLPQGIFTFVKSQNRTENCPKKQNPQALPSQGAASMEMRNSLCFQRRFCLFSSFRKPWVLLYCCCFSSFSSLRSVLSPGISRAMTKSLASAFVTRRAWRGCAILSVEGSKKTPCRSPVKRKKLSSSSPTAMGAR